MTFEEVIIQVESDGDDNAIGDKDQEYSAYGCLQVRWPVVLDLNNHYGVNWRARDCLGNRDISINMFHMYMNIYATKKVLHREPTDLDRARLWNGGPGAMIHQPVSNPKTEARLQLYWKKVEKLLLSKK